MYYLKLSTTCMLNKRIALAKIILDRCWKLTLNQKIAKVAYIQHEISVDAY